jgi:iron complex outermembrane receptor protein
LKPESGKNAEAGVLFFAGNNLLNTSLSLNAFYMDIENWIEWRNFGEWQAQNVLEVVSKGIEVHSESEFGTDAYTIGLTVNYSFNPVEPVKNLDENGLMNRQMNYVPKHVANAALNSEIKNWHFFVDGQFTGERFTDDFGHTIDGFFILNCGLIRDFQVKNQFFSLNLLFNNLLNADYQNQKYYAMPGRSFQLGLKYDFKSKK